MNTSNLLTDMDGTKINIGDVVIFTSYNSTRIFKGVIKKTNERQVTILVNKGYRKYFSRNIVLRNPKNISINLSVEEVELLIHELQVLHSQMKGTKLTDETLELYQENRKMRKALQYIATWELPKVTNQETKQTMSYEAAYGSNGARNYMINVAKAAIPK